MLDIAERLYPISDINFAPLSPIFGGSDIKFSPILFIMDIRLNARLIYNNLSLSLLLWASLTNPEPVLLLGREVF